MDIAHYTIALAGVTAALAVPAHAARFPAGRYDCVGPGDPAEHATLWLRAGGRYVYDEYMDLLGNHRTVGGGHYRRAGRRIAFRGGPLRDRALHGVWRRPSHGDPHGWIAFYDRRGRNAGLRCGKA